MKKFKDLRTQLNEDSESYYDAKYRVGPIGGNNEVDQTDAAIFDLARPESVRRINTYLGAAESKPVLDPNSVLRQIQRKLSIIGLQFTIPASDLGSRARYGFTPQDDGGVGTTTREYPLSYLGGRFGMLGNDGKFGYDDNISHRLGHGLTLRIMYQNTPDGRTLVQPKIVQGPAIGGNSLAAPSMMSRQGEPMTSIGQKENYTMQNTGITTVIPKPASSDDKIVDMESPSKLDDLRSIVQRLKSMTPGQQNEGYTNLPPIDSEKHPQRKGLEGPFRLKSGKVVYYDPKGQTDPKQSPGLYYDAGTDMYMTHDEVAAHNRDR